MGSTDKVLYHLAIKRQMLTILSVLISSQKVVFVADTTVNFLVSCVVSFIWSTAKRWRLMCDISLVTLDQLCIEQSAAQPLCHCSLGMKPGGEINTVNTSPAIILQCCSHSPSKGRVYLEILHLPRAEAFWGLEKLHWN